MKRNNVVTAHAGRMLPAGFWNEAVKVKVWFSDKTVGEVCDARLLYWGKMPHHTPNIIYYKVMG